MAPKKRPPIERFMEKVVATYDGCWEWTAYVGNSGYGRFYVDDRGALAHRWSYEFHVGPIPDGLVLDHLCRNRKCVNPEHLEPVTLSENVLRGTSPEVNRERFRAITHCPQGHPYSDDNTYVNRGSRCCRICKRANARASYERNREAVIERSRLWALANPERARDLSREGQRRYRRRKNAEVAA